METLDNSTIWIVGAGYFGQKAIKSLSTRCKHIVTIDQKLDELSSLKRQFPGISFYMMSAEDMANAFFEEQPDWIIPTIPMHLAAIWLSKVLPIQESSDFLFSIMQEIKSDFHFFYEEGNSVLTISRLPENMLCQEICKAETPYCPTMRRPWKNGKLDEIFKEIMNNQTQFEGIVLSSYWLMDWTGGIKGSDLLLAKEKILSTQRKAVIVATASHCNGVVNSFAKG